MSSGWATGYLHGKRQDGLLLAGGCLCGTFILPLLLPGLNSGSSHAPHHVVLVQVCMHACSQHSQTGSEFSKRWVAAGVVRDAAMPRTMLCSVRSACMRVQSGSQQLAIFSCPQKGASSSALHQLVLVQICMHLQSVA